VLLRYIVSFTGTCFIRDTHFCYTEVLGGPKGARSEGVSHQWADKDVLLITRSSGSDKEEYGKEQKMSITKYSMSVESRNEEGTVSAVVQSIQRIRSSLETIAYG
jgi:hypothetical protein